MLLTVLICTYNRAASLRVALDGLMEQELPPELAREWEILVVDNNSTDSTRQLVEQLARSSGCPLRYAFEPRQGKSHALNPGVRLAAGDLIALTDDDVLIPKGWVRSVVEAGRRYPQYRAFGGKVVPEWPQQVPKWIQPSGPYARPIVGGVIVSHDRGESDREYDSSMWAPIGANMFFRREVFADYGDFRVDLGPTGSGRLYVNEDCEFCFRIMDAGERNLYYPGALIVHPVAEEKFSPRYLQAYFRDAGRKQALERADEPGSRRLKLAVHSALRCANHTVHYLQHRLTGNAAAAMHHRCRLNYFGARSWHLLRLTLPATAGGAAVSPE
jgi:glycosyltransferase involved in cell wall biosynthesis